MAYSQSTPIHVLLLNCDQLVDLDAIQLTLFPHDIFDVKAEYFCLRDMKKKSEEINARRDIDLGVFVVHANESRLSINEPDAGIGYAAAYKALFDVTDQKVVVGIGHDSNSTDKTQLISKWAYSKIASQFSTEYLEGPAGYVFSWKDAPHEYHVKTVGDYLKSKFPDTDFSGYEHIINKTKLAATATVTNQDNPGVTGDMGNKHDENTISVEDETKSDATVTVTKQDSPGVTGDLVDQPDEKALSVEDADTKLRDDSEGESGSGDDTRVPSGEVSDKLEYTDPPIAGIDHRKQQKCKHPDAKNKAETNKSVKKTGSSTVSGERLRMIKRKLINDTETFHYLLRYVNMENYETILHIYCCIDGERDCLFIDDLIKAYNLDTISTPRGWFWEVDEVKRCVKESGLCAILLQSEKDKTFRVEVVDMHDVYRKQTAYVPADWDSLW